MPLRAQTVSVKLLRYHLDYAAALADVWLHKAEGRDAAACEAFERFMEEFGRHEFEIAPYFDQWMCYASLHRLICEPDTFAAQS